MFSTLYKLLIMSIVILCKFDFLQLMKKIFNITPIGIILECVLLCIILSFNFKILKIF